MYKQKKRQGVIILVIVVLIISFIFAAVQNRNAELQVYTEADHVESGKASGDGEAEKAVNLDYYTDEAYSYTLGVPEGWTKVNQDDGMLFVHNASKSSIQVQVMDYEPSICNATAESLSAVVAGEGKTFMGFQWVSNTHYELMYQDLKDITYDYIEEVFFDREHIIKITCVFDDANYAKLKDAYEASLNSFSWEQSSPIPDGYRLCYNQDAGFETGIPDTWTVSLTDTGMAAIDSGQAISMAVYMVPTLGELSQISSTEMSSFLGAGRDGFIMSSYEHTDDYAEVHTSYVADGVRYQNPFYLFQGNGNWYVVSFEYEEGMFQDDSIIDTCISLFRYFPNPGT